MPFTLTMPKLSPTMQEGVIAKWHKKEGDFVDAGDLLLEVATDKATVEHQALDRGYLRKLLKNEGDAAIVNEPLAIFTENQTENIENYQPEGITPQSTVKAAAAPATPKLQTQKMLKTQIAQPTTTPATVRQAPSLAPQEQPKDRIIASPLAKSQARLQSLDLSKVEGTGPHGRIMSRDLANAPLISQVSSASSFDRFPDQEEQLTPMRKVIAERLQYSKNSIPHFYIQQTVDVDRLVTMREEIKKEGANYTINDFMIKAVAIALRQHPFVNSGFNPENNHIIRYANIDIAVAVTVQGGLITPILHNTDTLSIAAISEKIKILAQKAKEGRLAPEEYQGGSFTISNLGMFGTTSFAAIVNPPQGAILSIGAIQDAAVVKNGIVVAGKLLALTLSCDHRVIDGAEAAQFMKTLKKLIEQPSLFLVA